MRLKTKMKSLGKLAVKQKAKLLEKARFENRDFNLRQTSSRMSHQAESIMDLEKIEANCTYPSSSQKSFNQAPEKQRLDPRSPAKKKSDLSRNSPSTAMDIERNGPKYTRLLVPPLVGLEEHLKELKKKKMIIPEVLITGQ